MPARELVLGVTGGIAAYKSAELASQLVQADFRVSTVLTAAAEQFIGSTTFEALTGRPVYRHLFDPVDEFQGAHIGLARRAELLVIAPASADFLARMANGLADDLLSTLVLAMNAPVLVAPAMNTSMWNHPAVQRNLQQVRDDGVHVVDPESGWLSCGQVGEGRMAPPAVIAGRVRQLLDGEAPAANLSEH